MLDNNPALTVQSFLQIDQNAVGRALATAHDFAARADCGEATGVRLAVIVEELVGNIIEHGRCGGGSVIEMTLVMIDGEISLSLIDSGISFDPRRIARPDTPPERGGGAGIAMVLAWSHGVTWERRGGRNHLRLVIAAE